jgi:hypothetical protein
MCLINIERMVMIYYSGIAIWEKIRLHPLLDEAAYCAALRLYGNRPLPHGSTSTDTSNTAAVLRVWGDMKAGGSAGLKLTVTSYNAFLHALAPRGQVQVLLSFISDMEETGSFVPLSMH